MVQANVRGRDVGGFVDEARRQIDDTITMPPGYYVRFGGQYEQLQRAQERLMVVVPIALGLILRSLLHVRARPRCAPRLHEVLN